MDENKKTSLFDKIAKISLGGIIFLMPIFFLPIMGMSLASSKFILLTILTLVATVSYSLARMSDKKYILPSTTATYITLALPIVMLLSAIAKGRFMDSFFGFGFEPTTVASVTVFSVLALLSSFYARDEKAVKCAKKLILGSFAVVFLYQVVRLFGSADTLTLGMFQGKNANLIDKWNDLAIFAAMIFTSSFIFLKDTKDKKMYKVLAVLVLSGLLLKVVVFSIIFPIMAVLLALYLVIDSKESGKITLFTKKGMTMHRMFGSFLVVVLVLYSLLGVQAVKVNSKGQILHPTLYKLVNLVPNYFGGTPSEIRPSFTSSANVMAKEIKASPIFGAGPNRFPESWNMYKSADLNQTPFWNTDFVYAVGYFPTLAITTGLLGVIAIIAFVVYSLIATLKLAVKNDLSKRDRAFAYSALILLILSVWYVPATTFLVYLFMLVGFVFSKSGQTVVELSGNKKYLPIADLAVTLVFFAALITVSGKSYLATRNYALASTAIQGGNIAAAQSYLEKASALRDVDVFARGLAELQIIKSNAIVSQNTQNGQTLSDENKDLAIAEYAKAQDSAERAITLYPQNYLNYLYAASVYAGNPTQYDKAIDLYNKALTYSPNNPNAYFGIAKVKAAQGDVEGAKEYIKKSLEMRAAYTPAHLANAQFSALDKDTKGTLENLALAYQSDPSRGDILLQIADIQLNALDDIKSATQTLEYAVGTNPNYADARVALATLYAKQEKYDDAANLLTGIVSEDKDIQAKINSFISELKDHKNPFANQTAPAEKETKTETAATSTAQ